MFSHFSCPGSVRVQTTKFTEQIDTVAYRTPDGRIVLILLNKGKELEAVNIRLGKMVGSLLLPAGILAACEIEM